MKLILPFKLIAALLLTLFLGACAAPAPKYDYTAFQQNRPKSILVLPPQNESPEVDATNGMLARATLPLAESGYYVFPVTLVVETFRQNGLNSPADIQQVPYAKLREIFGADSALYMNITQYGTSYQLVASDTRVTADAKLVDLRSGDTLWTGSATASSKEGEGNSGGGLIGVLVKAVINQIVHTLTDHSYKIAGVTSTRLLSAGRPNGILYGPRSPMYMKDGAPPR
jgi:hypothetical protein